MQTSTVKIVHSDNFEFNQIKSVSVFGGIEYNSDSTTSEVWNYLEGTETESKHIVKLFRKNELDVKLFSRRYATEKEFKQIASKSNIIHIASHGFFYPDPGLEIEEADNVTEYGDIEFRGGERGIGVETFVESTNPLMRSGLVLAGANDVWRSTGKIEGEDGVLTAQEVALIDMRNTTLVVMSACETGLGEIRGSEGVYGLQRSFKMAGVDNLIMSLWKVPDKETVAFMKSFYKKLLKYEDIKKAFHETQQEMRFKYDPYFWAAFVLIE